MKSVLATLAVAVLLACSHACEGADSAKDKKKEAPKPINKICPVEGGEVDPKVTTEYKGKVIGFCCDGCPDEFKKDPKKFMAKVDKELADEKAKSKDKGKGKDEKKDDKKDADKGKSDDKKDADKGKDKEAKLNTKCPVSGDDADSGITTKYEGRSIAFCCEDCEKDFKKDPKKYIAKLDEKKK
jgi:YHS domain-containing protein